MQHPQHPQHTPQAQAQLPQHAPTIDMGALSSAFATVTVRVYGCELSPAHRVTEMDVALLHALSSAIQAVHALQKSNFLAQAHEEQASGVIRP